METAEVLGVSESTVKRDWQMAKAWLHRELTKIRGRENAIQMSRADDLRLSAKLENSKPKAVINDMADEKWQKVREIFDSALRREPEERRRFIHEACGGDKTLLAEVESLLSSLDSAESFMETPAVAKVADVIEAETKKLEAGKSFGHYEIIKQIGEGGMGEVYLAEDTRLERKTAIKILPGNVAQDEERMQRFVREAKSASALNHPNIITIYEIGETDNTHFIATEYIEGDTLRERLKGRALISNPRLR